MISEAIRWSRSLAWLPDERAATPLRWGLMSNVRVVRVGAEHVHEMQPCIDGRYCVYTVCGARCERQRALGALKSERIRVTIAVKHWANFEREVCMTGRRSGGEREGRGAGAGVVVCGVSARAQGPRNCLPD